MLNASTTEPGRLIKRYLTLLLIFYFIDAAALLYNISVPLGLIYGPLILLTAIRAADNSMNFSSLHIFPFLMFSFVKILSVYGVFFDVSWVSIISQVFSAGYDVVMALSVFFYAAAYLFFLRNNKTAHYKARQLLNMLCFVMIAYALLQLFPESGSIFGASFFPLYMFPGVSVFFIVYYTIREQYEAIADSANIHSSGLPGDKASCEIIGKLKEDIEENQLYLNPSLSPETLAAKLNLQKDELFMFLSSNLGKTYYQLIAEYRVAYARKRLEEDINVTIEALAYECGFNSKTTLNKYFKEVTGMVPSRYRAESKKTYL